MYSYLAHGVTDTASLLTLGRNRTYALLSKHVDHDGVATAYLLMLLTTFDVEMARPERPMTSLPKYQHQLHATAPMA